MGCSLVFLVNSIYPCGMEDVKQSKQKELRVIDTLEPVMNQHRLIIDKGLVERDIRKAMTDGRIVIVCSIQC